MVLRRVLCLVALFAACTDGFGDTLTITSNRVIDAQNSLPESAIRVLDGPNASTRVTIEAGGQVATLSGETSTLSQNSELWLTGGSFGGPLIVTDNSTVAMFDGLIGSPDEPWFDSAVVTVEDDAQVSFRGGLLNVAASAEFGIVANGRSHVDIQGGEILAEFLARAIVLNDAATMQLSGGILVGDELSLVMANGRSSIVMTGGKVITDDASGFLLTESSRAIVQDANFAAREGNGITMYDSTELTTVRGRLAASEGAGLFLVDGRALVIGTILTSNDGSGMVMRNGIARIYDADISGDDSAALHVLGASRVRLVDSNVENTDEDYGVVADENAVVDIFSGRIRGVGALLQSVINIRGGEIIGVEDDPGDTPFAISGRTSGTINIYGRDLQLDNTSVSGVLLDGTPFHYHHAGANASIQLHDQSVVDFDDDGRITTNDINSLAMAIRDSNTDARYDLDGSGSTTLTDHSFLISDFLGAEAGDANLDNRFDSADLVEVFQFAHYESLPPGIAGWESGDWNGDGNFNSSDLVLAFKSHHYIGSATAAEVVPEPRASVLFIAGVLLVACQRIFMP